MVAAVQSTTSAQSSTGTSSVSSASKSNMVDYNTFLQLLLAQLKNQDPTKPMDSTEYMSQLASFSQVEQQTNTNSKLDALISSMSLTQAESYIGRTVANSDGSITGKVVSVNISSSGSVATLDNGKTLTLGEGITVS